jgi:hypothetical protein
VPAESLVVFDQAIQQASAKLRALGNMEVFAEKPMEIGAGLDVGAGRSG